MLKNLLIIFCFITLNECFSQKQLWSMTTSGGKYNAGGIFKTDSSGNNQKMVHSFYQVEGANPLNTKLTMAHNGKLYGLTYYDGFENSGILFQYDVSTDSFTKILDFGGISKGAYPVGSLLLASDSMLYGMTLNGGTDNWGVLFQFNPTNYTFTKKIDFKAGSNGRNPSGSLLQAADGNLYGTTANGGTNDMGVIFQYSIKNNTYSKKLDFNGTTNGNAPLGSMIQATDGKLYGMTSGGGTYNRGVIFKYDYTTNTYQKKGEFDGAITGSFPSGDLMQASDGFIYGLTKNGGAYNKGILFQYTISSGLFTKKVDFNAVADGNYPQGVLMEASNGKLYGTTVNGGSENLGTLFQYDPSTGIYSKKTDFTKSNGSNPNGYLVQLSGGLIYGMTISGGIASQGTMFKYDIASNNYVKLFDFGKAVNGAGPFGSLVQHDDGKLYGMTCAGGVYNLGTIFRIDPVNGKCSKLIDFGGITEGSTPFGTLLKAKDGKLYGMTKYGGIKNYGIIFQYNPINNTLIKKINFDSASNGRNPSGSLIQASNGKFYGLTFYGGKSDNGVLFQYDLGNNTCIGEFEFNGSVSGSHPDGSLLQADDGNFYGLTLSGGAKSLGVLFQYNPTLKVYTKLRDYIGGATGNSPSGDLIQATDSMLYGMTWDGGLNGQGTLFQYNILNNTYTVKLSLDGTNSGSKPQGSLFQASDGKLYGMTYYGGTNNKGILFQYDLITNGLVKKLDFNILNGWAPFYSKLIEISVPKTSIETNLKREHINVCPNPNNGDFTINNLVQGNYKIIDEIGQTIKEFDAVENQQITISATDLPGGIYFILCTANQKISGEKIVILR